MVRQEAMPRAVQVVKTKAGASRKKEASASASRHTPGMHSKLVFTILALLLAAACSSTPAPGDGGTDAAGDGGNPPTTCTGDFDCPSASQHCYFPMDGHCTVQGETGTCMEFQEPDACQPNVSCGCDGTTISVCAPAGYVNRVSNFSGPCPADAGTADGSTDATAE